MGLEVFGIRHHGPGCARSLLHALDAMRPDLVLVEGPPDADALIAAAAPPGMVPPVALLLWRPDAPQRATFYPFAEYSPEWQALRWAAAHGVPARFCDLPWAHRFADADDAEQDTDGDGDDRNNRDPLAWLARADGYSDSERWWNDRIEERAGDRALFAAIGEAVGAVRAELALPETPLTLRREAWMRRTLRGAAKEGFANVAFVCGAWHAPAMSGGSARDDDALLKGLGKVKVEATWTPWSNDRLTRANGYGAGVVAPGWYEHLWAGGDDVAARWLVRAARVLRTKDLPASCASAIDAVRLAGALAGLRGRPVAGLPELGEAIRTTFGGGDGTAAALLERELVVGDRLGELPPDVARLPLEQDLHAQQRSLRLAPKAGPTTVELDLREDGGRARSVLLHRLLALRLAWGERLSDHRARGSFKESWRLQWRPEFALALIDASAFGNTVADAAARRLAHDAERAFELAVRVEWLDLALRAELPQAATAVLAAVQERATATDDATALLAAIPPLVRIARYGDVRSLDPATVRHLLAGLAVRAHVALPAAASGIDDDASTAFASTLRAHHEALQLLADGELLADAHAALAGLRTRAAVHARVRGTAVRLLRDGGAIAAGEVALQLGRELSPGAEPAAAAAWLDGLLAGSGHVLALERPLLELLDAWVAGLAEAHFQAVLPLVRRTLGSFAPGERARIAAAVRTLRDGPRASAAGAAGAPLALDEARAAPAVAAVAALLGLPGIAGAP